ncbi:ABC transporter permease [Mucilaginibacter sp. SP1R1]|uniref:ABC transporter permease n=1 Tax=Mucilaginibacter sp. SP1R1 TaxID=2723091 RepID=UPI00161B680B|nr:ABC transporter permease [Mucilaginibacter sp. SP1R1]MBB6148774.1 ABC-type antimicrobial peptide transport system permease subunit [Mucilaginibacter sp. SP1R1]
MIKNYFKIAFRNFWKHKLFTFINIIGLSIGISSALVIYLIVHFDFTFNQSFTDGDRIYRVVSNYTFSGESVYNSGVSGGLPEAVKNEVSGLAASVPFFGISQPNVLIPAKSGAPVKFKIQDNVILADGRYFNLFNYTWLAGTAKTALNAPNQVVLTTDQAKKYFPGLSYHQMLGRVVTYDTLSTTVIGIVEPLKGNNDFAFHDFISYSTANSNKALSDELRLKDWGGTTSDSQFFIKLLPNTTVAHIEKQLGELLKKNSPPKPSDKGNTRSFHLQPLSDLHFNEVIGTFGGRVASKTTLYGLLAIALFLLVLGCINFVNLTTAQATQRAKEIGIRKTMGSSRTQLIIQFLSETFLITLFAVVVSIAITPIILKLFANFIPAGISLDLLKQPNLIIFLVLLTVVVSLLSGFYPAVMLSGYKPVSVLKNQTVANRSKTRNAWLRKSLTVTQFVIAQFFIMATVLVSKQIYYVLHKDLGFKKDAIIIINSPWKNRTDSRNQVFLNRLRAIPQINLVSVGRDAPSSSSSNSTEATYKDGKKEIKLELYEKFGDPNYINVYKLKLLAGRNLQPSDTSKAFIINNTYARLIGFKNPHDAIGKQVDNFNGDKKMEIIGVVSDFYPESLHSPIKPLAILTSKEHYDTGTFHIALNAETAGGNEWKKAITGMDKAWREVYPDDDFEYHFFDENIAKFYESEQHTSALLTWATGLSILISCLGLLGLAMYTTNLRTKEIGVRKVLGASVTQIVTLLSTELVLLTVLAFILVTPVAWYAMNKWMQTFADRTTISWWIFALSGAGMLLATLCTLSFQTIKAAVANPARSLRSE